jgi:hypothetical protein
MKGGIAFRMKNAKNVRLSLNRCHLRINLADDPVVVEPVSGFPSLLTGKLTGNFVIFAQTR